MANTTVVENTFSSAFLLDKSKISRMMNIIDDKVKSLGIPSKLTLDLTLESGKKVGLATLDELFAIDNAIRNPISFLTIEVNSLNNDSTKGIKASISYQNSRENNISARVESAESGQALQLFAELEEQIERTFLKDWVYRFMNKEIFLAAFSLVAAVVTMLFTFFALPSSISSSRIQQATADTLIEKYSTAVTQEEKIDFLFDYSMEQLKTSKTKDLSAFSLNKFLNLQTLFIVLPILIVIGALIYLFTKCYPYANFLWGDYEEYYSQIKSTKSTLWNLIIGSILLGVIGNLFVIGISGFLKLGQ